MHWLCSFFSLPRRKREGGEREDSSTVDQQEQHPKTQIRLALTPWWSPAGPLPWSQVNFTRMQSSTFVLTQLACNNSSNHEHSPTFWSIFASARCLITVQVHEDCYTVLPCLYSLISTILYFLKRQHNLRWELSSCAEHDLWFHLLLKCLGWRRILAELDGLQFLWTHCDVGGYVSVITSWAKAYAVYSLDYLLFFFFFFFFFLKKNTCGRHI